MKKERRTEHWQNLKKDFLIIIFSIIIAILLAKTKALNNFLVYTKEIKFLSSFLVGLFFISIATVTPATILLIELFKTNSIIEVSIFAGAAAVVGDLFIFRFIKTHLADDLLFLAQKVRHERAKEILNLKIFRWIVPLVGALIIASPLPDEIGLMLMGLSKTKSKIFIPLSFILNFLGILIIGLTTRMIIK